MIGKGGKNIKSLRTDVSTFTPFLIGVSAGYINSTHPLILGCTLGMNDFNALYVKVEAFYIW